MDTCVSLNQTEASSYNYNLNKKSIKLNALFHTASPAFPQEYSTLHRAFEQSIITIVAAAVFDIWIFFIIIND